jgi:hypothetical protein
MYLPFGDLLGDGHRQAEKVLIDAPSMEHLLNAQTAIKEKYGDDFFETYANDWETPCLSQANWKAIVECKYPIERLQMFDHYNDWRGLATVEEALEIDDNPFISIGAIIDTFIWLLNWHDAQIVRAEEDYIPTINDWTCSGFETVGYGCFDY